MDGRKMFRQTNAKQTNAQTQPRQPNKQMVEIEGRRLLLKEQKSSLSSKGNNGESKTTSNLRISRELRFIPFVYTVTNNPNRRYKTAELKLDKEILKRLTLCSSRSLKYAVWLFHVVVL